MSAHLTIVVPKVLDQDNRRAFADEVMALPLTPYLVALDCSGTTYINSSGLTVLVSLSKRIRERGQCLVVRGLSDDLLTLFDLCGLRQLLCDFDPEARRKALRRAGVRPARRSAHRPDRPPAIKPPTKWERFVLRWFR